MALTRRVPSEDRQFFELVAQTAFCNPFSDRRTELDSAIVGRPVERMSEAHLEEMTQAVVNRVEKLDRDAVADIRRFSGQERQLMQTVFLFVVFHQFAREFDGLILEQVKLGTQSVAVKFAGDVLAALARRGIGATEAQRFFAIFYQLRRAYYFIARGLVGKSKCMRELRRHLWQNVFTQEVTLYDRYLWNRMEDFSTLLLGETGTGKGAAAAAIGRSGYIPFDTNQGRFAESFMRGFVALNLSQFPETLIESELFGHRKGAFTGAIESHEGVLARCSPHGAIFLDEIGDVSVPVQIKLLQVLQERTFCPVGSHEPLRFRGRVIAATNRPMESLRESKLFRDDFFYRLCSDVIQVPPLRQRLQEAPDELRQLIVHLLTALTGEPTPELVDRIEKALQTTSHSWAGNVRELEQAIRRILITGEYSPRTELAPSNQRDQFLKGIINGQLSAEELLSGYCGLLYDKHRTYEEVARRANLDRRTVKRYLQEQGSGKNPPGL